MDSSDITNQCNALLNEFGRPSFIVFGYQKDDESFGISYSTHKVQPQTVVKGLSWALHDMAQKKL